MSVRLKIEKIPEGLLATISRRDAEGKVIGRPSVSRVASKAEAKRLADALARSLGLKVYGVVDKTGPAVRSPAPQTDTSKAAHPDADGNLPEELSAPWLVPGVAKSL